MPRQRPCIGHRGPCPTRALTRDPTSRCTTCRSAWHQARDQARGSRQDRGYDHEHEQLRLQVLDRDKHTCHWCGGKANTADHVIPLAEGGTNTLSNYVAACTPCNSRRGGTGKATLNF